MPKSDFTSTERAIIQEACQLWSDIGHDCCNETGQPWEDEEVASIVQDSLRDRLLDVGPELAVAWDALTYERKHALCLYAL